MDFLRVFMPATKTQIRGYETPLSRACEARSVSQRPLLRDETISLVMVPVS